MEYLPALRAKAPAVAVKEGSKLARVSPAEVGEGTKTGRERAPGESLKRGELAVLLHQPDKADAVAAWTRKRAEWFRCTDFVDRRQRSNTKTGKWSRGTHRAPYAGSA